MKQIDRRATLFQLLWRIENAATPILVNAEALAKHGRKGDRPLAVEIIGQARLTKKLVAEARALLSP